jgi:hypothetical protein
MGKRKADYFEAYVGALSMVDINAAFSFVEKVIRLIDLKTDLKIPPPPIRDYKSDIHIKELDVPILGSDPKTYIAQMWQFIHKESFKPENLIYD